MALMLDKKCVTLFFDALFYGFLTVHKVYSERFEKKEEERNTLLMREARGEWQGWLKLKEKLR